MTRRESIRTATLLAIGMALQKLDALKAEGGQLTVDLNQWANVVFKHNGKTITITVAEIFRSLAATAGTPPSTVPKP